MSMYQLFLVLSTFSFSLLFIWIIKANALKLGLVDIPNSRSSHKKITPRGAGIGFGFAYILFSSFSVWGLLPNLWLLILAIFMVYLIGILDDHKDASPKTKFYVIFFSCFLLYMDDISITSLGQYFGYDLTLSYFALPFTMFALAGFTNALNLIDGIDGLAGSIAVVILSSFLYIGYVFSDTLIFYLSLHAIIAVLAFLFFNWHPAKIFMGDSGSLLLGFLVSLIATLSLKYIHPIVVLYLAALPIIDTLVVMTRRVRRGKSPFSPDKTHIHHILLNFFEQKVRKTVLFLILLQVLFSTFGLFLVDSYDDMGEGMLSSIALLVFGGINILAYMLFTGMKRRQRLVDKVQKRKQRHNLSLIHI